MHGERVLWRVILFNESRIQHAQPVNPGFKILPDVIVLLKQIKRRVTLLLGQPANRAPDINIGETSTLGPITSIYPSEYFARIGARLGVFRGKGGLCMLEDHIHQRGCRNHFFQSDWAILRCGVVPGMDA